MIEIPRNYLKAMTMCAPKKEIRYYLCGVHVTYTGDLDYAHLAATNGHYMLIGRTPGRDTLPIDIIIPRDVAAAEGKGKDAVILKHEQGDTWRLGNTLFEPIDGRFPQYWTAVPRGELSGETAQFNPEYLALVDKAIRTWTGNKKPCTIRHNGMAPGLMQPLQPETDVFGVIMPFRDPAECEMHDWPEFNPPAEPDRETA